MLEPSLIFAIFLIFFGAAVLSTAALLTRQSMLVAYIVLGMLLGPWGLQFIHDPELVRDVGDIGILFLLFLLGLHLPPQKLIHMLRKASWVALISSIIFAGIGFISAHFFGFDNKACFIISVAMMFSSTIMGIKLLPTTVLHHQHTGEVMISILLLQDILAIAVLLILRIMMLGGAEIKDVLGIFLGFPLMLIFAYMVERYVLHRLFAKFNRIKEYLFLLAIAWCLSMSQLAAYLGLSAEVGAFIAGVSLAASPISLYIAESLRPVRDFFLVLFFFAVGAKFNFHYLPQVILPALLITIVLQLVKPFTYRWLLQQVGEEKSIAWEVGVRLAQFSEFSLIIAYIAIDDRSITDSAAYLIQAVTILSFIISSYWVVLCFPTPIALSDKLRRD